MVEELGRTMQGARLLITGGTGFVGTSYVRAFRMKSEKPDLFSQLILGSRHPVSIIDRDIRHVSIDMDDSHLSLPEVDVILHAATPASAKLNSESPDIMYSTIVQGMRNLINAISNWSRPPKVVFTSSGAVYRNEQLSKKQIDEMTNIDINTLIDAYSRGKFEAEKLLLEASSAGICEAVILRLFTFSGIDIPRNKHFAIGNFVRDAVTYQRIVVRSDGQSMRSYLDQRDMVNWINSAIREGRSGNIYHIGSEEAISIAQLAHLVAKRFEILSGKKVDVAIMGQTSEIDGVDWYIPSTHRTRKLLSVQQTIPTVESIDSMISYDLNEWNYKIK